MNVLFIICHDISPRFGCYDDSRAITPNINRLASQGLVFDRHYCHTALCGPTRANLMTGCRPETTQRWNNDSFFPQFRQRLGYVTLPEHFRRHDYQTVSVGQVMHGNEKDPPSWSVPQWWPGPSQIPAWAPSAGSFRHYRNADSTRVMRERMEQIRAEGIDPVAEPKKWRGPAVEAGIPPHEPYDEEHTTDRALQELRRLQDDGPFFLGVGYETGHLPWCTPQHYFEQYPEGTIELPKRMTLPDGAPPYARSVNEPAQYYTTYCYDRPWEATLHQTGELIRGHYAAISYFDAQVGRLLDEFDRLGVGEDTVVVLTTDHGFSLGEHGHFGKLTNYEPALRVPLIIRTPDGPTGGRTSALTEHVDLYPTLCELCGLSKPDHLEGTSATPLLEDAARPWKKATFSQQPRYREGLMGRSVRTDSLRLTRWQRDNGTVEATELYDYETHPLETVNIADQPENRAIIEELSTMIDAGWRGALPEDE